MMPSRFWLPGLVLGLAASPVLAWPGGPGWGGPGWGDPRGPGWDSDSAESRQGKVMVDRFLAPYAAAGLGQHDNAVVPAPGEPLDPEESAIFQAAVVDQLVKLGYDTARPGQGGLVTQVREGRDVVVPQEPRHNPVSGEVEAGTSNRGSGFGLGLSIDLSKPKAALLDTRLEVRIVDRISGKALWEGRADIITREGDRHWSDAAVAAKLAGVLFEKFPGPATPHR